MLQAGIISERYFFFDGKSVQITNATVSANMTNAGQLINPSRFRRFKGIGGLCLF
jgi:hypothetical protein